MTTFNPNIPAVSNNAQSDIAAIKDNFNELRRHEAGGSAPSNLVAGMLWADNSGSDIALKLRNKGNSAWINVTFPTGTKMVFCQASAPTGWTQDTANNDKCLRVVSGSGGGTGGSRGLTSAAVGDTTLTTNQMPSHGHSASTDTTGEHSHNVGIFDGNYYASDWQVDAVRDSFTSYVVTGSSGSHSHSVSVGGTGGGQAHNHALALAYIDVIIATKD